MSASRSLRSNKELGEVNSRHGSQGNLSRRASKDRSLLINTPEKRQSDVDIARGSRSRQEVIHNETINTQQSVSSAKFVDTPKHLYAMSERRSLHSNKVLGGVNSIHGSQDNLSRKASKDRSLLISTPEKRESGVDIARGSPSNSRFNSRRNSRQEVIHNETINPQQSVSSPKFVDTPKHLYGLDNPTDALAVTKDEEEPDTKCVNPSQMKFGSKILCQVTSAMLVCLCIFIIAALIGVVTHTNNKDASESPPLSEHQWQKFEALVEQQQNVIQTLEERIFLLESLPERLNMVEQSYKSMDDTKKEQKEPLDYQVLDEEWKQVMVSEMESFLERWDADKIGMADYALESAGGQVHSPYHSSTFTNGAAQVLLFGLPLWYDVKTPRVVIQRGNIPGECWAFKGQEGFLVIKLSQTIKPTSFTVEHMPASLSQLADKSTPSAPRQFSVWGWDDPNGSERTLLGEYVFDRKGKALQRFPVKVKTDSSFGFVELRVHSNHGNPLYTCIYRFRVHGTPLHGA